MKPMFKHRPGQVVINHIVDRTPEGPVHFLQGDCYTKRPDVYAANRQLVLLDPQDSSLNLDPDTNETTALEFGDEWVVLHADAGRYSLSIVVVEREFYEDRLGAFDNMTRVRELLDNPRGGELFDRDAEGA